MNLSRAGREEGRLKLGFELKEKYLELKGASVNHQQELLIKDVLVDEIMQKQMRSKDKQGSLLVFWAVLSKDVEEDSLNDRLQEGFCVNMWSLEERRGPV